MPNYYTGIDTHLSMSQKHLRAHCLLNYFRMLQDLGILRMKPVIVSSQNTDLSKIPTINSNFIIPTDNTV